MEDSVQKGETGWSGATVGGDTGSEQDEVASGR